jgi:hypothetical protein
MMEILGRPVLWRASIQADYDAKVNYPRMLMELGVCPQRQAVYQSIVGRRVCTSVGRAKVRI